MMQEETITLKDQKVQLLDKLRRVYRECPLHNGSNNHKRLKQLRAVVEEIMEIDKRISASGRS